MVVRFLDMREKLNNVEFNGVCLFGNDRWVRRKALSNVLGILGVSDDGLGVDYLDSPDVADIKLACNTLSLLGGKKAVVCENFVFPQGNKLYAVKKQLADLLANGDGSFCLIFIADTDKNFDIDGMEKVNCNHLDQNSVCKWIISYCKRQQVDADRYAAEKLALYCLNDMARVSVETQKLVDYGEFTLDSVEQLVHKDAEYVAYDLSQVIINRNASRALELYRGLIAGGEDARALFGLLYNYFRRVYYVKTSSCSTDELAAMFSVKAGAIEYAKDAASKFKPMQLRRALDCFEQADAELKVFLDENEVMTLLIMRLVSL